MRLHAGTRRRRAFAVVGLSIASLLALLITEYSLRALERPRSAAPLDYGDVCGTELRPGGLLHPGIRGEITDGLGGSVRWVTNSVGFRNDHEFLTEPAEGVLRVLSLGDSFGAGYRVDQDATYARTLERHFRSRLADSEVLLSVVQDPAEALAYVRAHGLQRQAPAL